MKKVLISAFTCAAVAVPVPVVGPITGFLVGGVGAALHDLGKKDDKKKGPKR